jgi:hypothetical protein
MLARSSTRARSCHQGRARPDEAAHATPVIPTPRGRPGDGSLDSARDGAASKASQLRRSLRRPFLESAGSFQATLPARRRASAGRCPDDDGRELRIRERERLPNSIDGIGAEP